MSDSTNKPKGNDELQMPDTIPGQQIPDSIPAPPVPDAEGGKDEPLPPGPLLGPSGFSLR